MPKNLWAKYYRENKERLQKKLVKDKKKATIWSWMLQKSLSRWKTTSLLSIEKNIEWEKTPLNSKL